MSVRLSLPRGHAMVLSELLTRYHDSRQRELVPDGAEWRALVLLLGKLERELSDGSGRDEWDRTVAAARRELGAYDGIPF
jgi:hypothetical protein